jgi:tripartite-type tricarboxylate transporter receptor subunit TctC
MTEGLHYPNHFQETSMTTRRRFLHASASLAVASVAAPAFAAPAWPNRPVRIIVPFAPGGTSDVIARLISNPLREALGQPVIVENRTGANGAVGAQVTASANDQHTVLLSDMSSLSIAPLVQKDLPYKLADLTGVTMLAYSPHLLVAHPSVPASNLQELVAFSKKTRVNAASAGSGSANHLGIVEIAQATGMQWQHVPYKGGAAALADTAAGNTHIVLNGMLATLPMVTGGKLKVLGVSKRSRVPLLAQSPTIAEQGVSNFESGTYQGIVAATSMPKEVIARLNTELIKIIRSPEMRARMTEAGAEVMTSTPAELNTFLQKERDRWAGVIAKAGNQLEGTA